MEVSVQTSTLFNLLWSQHTLQGAVCRVDLFFPDEIPSNGLVKVRDNLEVGRAIPYELGQLSFEGGGVRDYDLGGVYFLKRV